MDRAELIAFITRKSAYIPLLLLLSLIALVAGLLTGIQRTKPLPLRAAVTSAVSSASSSSTLGTSNPAATPVTGGQIHLPATGTTATPVATATTAPVPPASVTATVPPNSSGSSSSTTAIASVAVQPAATSSVPSPTTTASSPAGATPVATPVPQQRTSTVYAGSLADGWSAYPYKSTLNLSAGDGFMSWNAGVAGNIALINSGALDDTPYTYLSFRAQAGQTQGKYALQLSDAAGHTLSDGVDLDAYGTFSSGTSVLFKVPLSALGASEQSIHQISFQNTSGASNQTLSLADIAFTS